MSKTKKIKKAETSEIIPLRIIVFIFIFNTPFRYNVYSGIMFREKSIDLTE